MANDRMASNMATGPAAKFMKLLLTIFNVIFTISWIVFVGVQRSVDWGYNPEKISGIVFLGVGVWMKVSLQEFMQLSADYYINTPYIVISIGAIIFIVGSLGCCCTFKGQACLLYVYSGFLVVIFVIELSIGICGFIYRPSIEMGFQTGMNQAIANYPKGGSTAMDGLQEKLSCCGVASYADWFGTVWSRGQQSYAVPESCCSGDKKECTHSWDMPPDNTTDIYTEGCFQLVTDFMDANFAKIGGAAVGISFIQLFGAVIASCLAKNLNKAKYEQVA